MTTDAGKARIYNSGKPLDTEVSPREGGNSRVDSPCLRSYNA